MDEASVGIGMARRYRREELAGAATCEPRLPSVALTDFTSSQYHNVSLLLHPAALTTEII